MKCSLGSEKIVKNATDNNSVVLNGTTVSAPNRYFVFTYRYIDQITAAWLVNSTF